MDKKGKERTGKEWTVRKGKDRKGKEWKEKERKGRSLPQSPSPLVPLVDLSVSTMHDSVYLQLFKVIYI
ncbi:hypothetical protein EYF80_064314 [Liparis tanakae]|uniref:Uncharacterized protein n=1 Tax=Liparis tanakae TaxID=230148 RepID=A0A4Z2E9V9_9TELE|nr:hypothetical protein EYF80_064314 [Liparis tanakae]